MIFRELNHAKCQTYLVASGAQRRAAIIDPLREKVGLYLGVLAYHRLRLEMIIDMHTHADHRSGVRDLGGMLDWTDAGLSVKR